MPASELALATTWQTTGSASALDRHSDAENERVVQQSTQEASIATAGSSAQKT